MSSKYEEKPSLDEMRFELSRFTKITPDTPDDHIRLFYRLYKGVMDKQRPGWSRYEHELYFELLASGNDDINVNIQDLRNLIARNSESEGDYMGRWFDSDETEGV